MCKKILAALFCGALGLSFLIFNIFSKQLSGDNHENRLLTGLPQVLQSAPGELFDNLNSFIADNSPFRYQLVRQTQGGCERDFFDAFPEADVILLEGFKDSPYPKIEVVRAGNCAAPVCDPATLLAVATDLPLALEGIPVLGLDQVEAMAELILAQGR